MGKRTIALFLTVLMAASLAIGCGSSKHTTKSKKADDEVPEVELTETYALILSQSDNAYETKIEEGFIEVMETAGKSYTIDRPGQGTAEEQAKYVNKLISEKVSCIAVSPVDAEELAEPLQKALEAGIDVCAFDTPTTPDSRELFINQSGTEQISVTLMDAALDISGGIGDWAILSSQSSSSNESKWISAMRSTMKDEKYKDLNMVEIAYSDNQYQRAYDQTKSLLQNYPDLKTILVTDTDSIVAACEAVSDAESSVKVTGFGMPSKMSDYVGAAKVCPYFYLWNPIELGNLTAYVSIALRQEIITGELGEKFKAGEMGEFEVIESADTGTEIVVGYPYRFDEENIEEWKDQF